MSRKRLLFAVLGGGTAVAAALVAALVLSGGGGKAQPAAVGATGVAAMLRGIPQHGAVLGSASAPVTLVEFADPQCPYCRDWEAGALPDLVRSYVRLGKVRIVFNGVSFLGGDSETALRTAFAAGRQNHLWDVVALLYANQGTENTGWVTEPLLESIGRGVTGLDWKRVVGDRTSRGVDTALAAAAGVAQRAGINSVPSFAVGPTGGTLAMVQVRSLDAAGLTPAIDAALAG